MPRHQGFIRINQPKSIFAFVTMHLNSYLEWALYKFQVPLPSILFEPTIGWTSLFPVSGPLWVDQDPLHPQVPLSGVNFFLQLAQKSSLVVAPHLSLTSKRVLSLGVKCAGST